MDTYTVGRAELLSWINSTLQLNLTKIEQASVSSLYCTAHCLCISSPNLIERNEEVQLKPLGNNLNTNIYNIH